MERTFRPQPKPTKTPKKTPKPLKRTPLKKKRETPRKVDKTRTKLASGYNKPNGKQRGTFGADYDKAIEKHGAVCGELAYHDGVFGTCQGGLEMHHVKFRGRGGGDGKGKWRNGRPLCTKHHQLCHKSREYADKWRTIHEQLYGEHYWKDEWDLYKEGLIDEPTPEKYEEFMKGFENGSIHFR